MIPTCLENITPGALGWEGNIQDSKGDFECTFMKPPERRKLEREAQTCLEPHRGGDGNKSAMFVFGDSHARMLLVGLRQRFDDYLSVHFLCVSGSWCSAFHSLRGHATKVPCDNYDKVVKESLRRLLRPGDIVIFSNFDRHAARHGENHINASLERMVTRIGELHKIVHSQGANLVLVGSPPRIGCGARYLLKCSSGQHGSMPCGTCDVEVTASELDHKPLKDTYTRLASASDSIMFFDIHALLCDNVTCGAMIPGTRVKGHRDAHHLTRAASIYLAQFLCSALGRAGWMPKYLH